jgi:hypothetical protein
MLLIALVAWAARPVRARGDGGSVRLSERLGSYQITVFTSPTPFQAGPVDVSVLVQDSAGAPVQDARVKVRVAPVEEPSLSTSYPATHAAATNKLLYAAQFELPSPGQWRIDVHVEAGQETARTHFEVEAVAPPPRWREMLPWIALPALPIILFAIHQVMTRARKRVAQVG